MKKIRTIALFFSIASLAVVGLTGCALFGITPKTTAIVQDFSGCRLSWSGPEEISMYSVSCIGYRGSQTVEYRFIVNNNLANRYIRFHAYEAYDAEGNTYEVVFKNEKGYRPLPVSGDVFLPTGQDVYFTVIVNGILPSVSKITNLRMEWNITKPDHYVPESSGDLLMKNLPVYWK
ncbi:MAG: hypothetical protein J5808_02625 [Paludibacteraceae bacterium]|nr:hypothetical protein [Paludibacteraceae bacterium]